MENHNGKLQQNKLATDVNCGNEGDRNRIQL